MRAAVCLAVFAVGCSEPATGTPDDFVTIAPADGEGGVSIAARVTAEIPRDKAEQCRFSADNSTLTVTKDGTAVAGALVYFVDGLRIDFTPSGMFDYTTTYTVSVAVACGAPKTAAFTTRGRPGQVPDLRADDGFRIDALSVDEPGAIAPILRSFLADAQLVIQVLEVGADHLRLIGGEGDFPAVPPVGDDNLRVFKRDAFLFPMRGTYKAPYFQVEGTIRVPVDDQNDITLDRFEISGRLVGDRPNIEIGEAAIRASTSCDTLCVVPDNDIQLLCGNRAAICDTFGQLNLIGNYAGVPNDFSLVQTITVIPADAATGVAVDAVVDISLTAAVQTDRSGVIQVLLTPAGSTDAVPGALTIDTAGPSAGRHAVFDPTADLTPGTTYTLLVVAHGASETFFTTAP